MGPSPSRATSDRSCQSVHGFFRALLLFGASACAAGNPPSGASTAAPQADATASGAEPALTSAREPDFGGELALLAEAESALANSDYEAARAQTAEVVGRLIARPEAEQGPAWADVLGRAADAAMRAQDTQTAKQAFEGVLAFRTRTLDADHEDIQTTRGNLATAMAMLGDLEAARALQAEVLAHAERTMPPDDPDLQRVRANLAITLARSGRLAEARAEMERVVEAFRRTLPADDPDLQKACTNLASMRRSLGDAEGARELQEAVLAVRLATLPRDHPWLQNARLGLAATLKELGDLDGARTLELQVLEVRSRTLPEDHPELQSARQNLAGTLYLLGDPEGARALFEDVLAVRARTLPEDHPDLVTARANLALAIRDLGDLEGARALQEQVLASFVRTLPEDHPELRDARVNLASTAHRLGDYEGARVLYERALASGSRTLPPGHPTLQFIRANLALALQELGDLSAARSIQEDVLASSLRTLPEDHPDAARIRADLAVTIARQAATGGESPAAAHERCVELLLAAARAQVRSARQALLEGSSREAQARCASAAEGLELALSGSAGLGVFGPAPELDRAAFEISETTRGAMLAAAALRRRAGGAPRYEELCAKRAREADAIAELAQVGTTSQEFRAALARRDETERELADLARRIPGPASPFLDFETDRLAAILAPDEAIVGLRRTKLWRIEPRAGGGSKPRATESLCALVIARSGAASALPESGAAARLVRVDLGPIAPIEAAVRSWRASLGVAHDPRGLMATQEATADLGADACGDHLRQLLFDPLVPALGGASRVVIALDDVALLVPLDALPAPGDPARPAAARQPLGERWRIETRCTLAELLAPVSPRGADGGLVALGGAAFDAGPTDAADAVPAPAEAADGEPISREDPTRAAVLRGGSWASGFVPLPATGREAREIAALHARSQGATPGCATLEGREASRAALVQLAPHARWLHVATHGWFSHESIRSWEDPEPLDARAGPVPREDALEQVRGLSPLLLSGLALAGANRPPDAEGRVDGLLTAEEVATLDLTRCEMAVLSACDTNVGERRAGQGVFSLQMALQMAGARSVVTSLWKVPDEATRELMADFYRRIWVDGQPKYRALWDAKMHLRDARDEAGNPRYALRDWAAWVLTGEPD